MFANASAFWFLGLSLPILAAHLYRGRRRRAEVPYLRLWEGAMRDAPQRSALGVPRHLVSLVLNLALLALLCLALARPGPGDSAASAAPAPGDPARPLAIVLDATLSLRAREGDERRFDLARREADRLVRAARGPVRVFCAGRGVEAWTDVGPDRGPWARWIAAREPLGQAGTLVPAVEAAAAWRQGLGGGRLVLLTDGCTGGEPGVADAVKAARAEAVLCGAPRPNLAIVEGRATRAWGEREAEVFFRVRNFGGEARDCTIAATLDDAPSKNFTRTIPAGGSEGFPFSLEAEGGGRLALRILSDDALPEDNAVRLLVPPRRRPRVLAFQTGAPNPFLRRALAALGDRIDGAGSGFAAPHVWEDVAKTVHPDDVVIFDDCAPTDALRPAGYLFLRPRGPYAPARGKEAEQPASPAWRRGRWTQGLPDVGALRVRQSTVLRPEGGMETLLDSEAGPLAVAGEDEAEGVRFVAVGFRLEDSNFPLLAAFPVFLRNVFDGLTGEERRFLPASLALGAPLAPARALPAAAGAEGRLSRLPEAADDDAARARWAEPMRVAIRAGGFLTPALSACGVYRFEAGGVREAAAVNFTNEGESELRPVDLAGSAASVTVVSAREAPWTAEALLVAAALGLLALEWWLFQRGVI